MNIFFVQREGGRTVVVTPQLTGSLLAGITRDSILRLARDAGFGAEERQVSVDEWETAARKGRFTEAFACGTAAVITPIGALKSERRSWTMGDGKSGPVTTQLREMLVSIQYGRTADRYGWVHKVVEPPWAWLFPGFLRVFAPPARRVSRSTNGCVLRSCRPRSSGPRLRRRNGREGRRDGDRPAHREGDRDAGADRRDPDRDVDLDLDLDPDPDPDPDPDLDPNPPPPIGHLEGWANLAHLFDSFATVDDGRAHDDVRIVQFGDSHTACDVGTGAFRHALQARFGDGGRGFVSIGRPWKTYYQEGTRGGMAGDFEAAKITFKDGRYWGDGHYGLLGVGVRAAQGGSRAWTEVSSAFSRVEIAYWQQPQGGILRRPGRRGQGGAGGDARRSARLRLLRARICPTRPTRSSSTRSARARSASSA